ncbi:DUF6161 domain-containing protein [Pseudomonas sp. YuFO8]|uniref:DUF6161 domain-containing protein n=1 Tax=Pseudomonas sp. YuFO8 TaxID=3095361 RepID=UPI002B25464C|nr:DUF6161 domain-containing protein [Pseudomonas sp. YuFO8]MEB2622103.1 DUF6161 domain-containing protein [Pseudomonas sp. YuFO8]
MLNKEVDLLINEDKVITFSSTNQLKDFISAELKQWAWLKSLPDEITAAGQKLYEIIFARQLNQCLHEQADTLDDDPKFHLGRRFQPIILSISADGQLIDKIKDRFGTIAGFMAVVFINMTNRHAMIEYPIIKSAVEIPGFAYERIAAIQVILAHQNADKIISNSHIESIHLQYAEFESRQTEVMGRMNSSAELFSSQIDTLRVNVEKAASKVNFNFKRRIGLWRKVARQTSTDAKAKLDAAQNHLNSAQAAYRAQIDLSDSVKHWEDRKTYHQKHKNLWFAGVIASMISTFAAMVIYFKYGGMLALSNLPVSSIQPDYSTPVAQISGALLLITLMGIVIRITLRQFNSHSHLALESQERIIFTKTYLTLMRDGKLDSELDRRLILESLFRPTQANGASEITFSPPLEMIYKAISERK